MILGPAGFDADSSRSSANGGHRGDRLRHPKKPDTTPMGETPNKNRHPFGY